MALHPHRKPRTAYHRTHPVFMFYAYASIITGTWITTWVLTAVR